MLPNLFGPTLAGYRIIPTQVAVLLTPQLWRDVETCLAILFVLGIAAGLSFLLKAALQGKQPQPVEQSEARPITEVLAEAFAIIGGISRARPTREHLKALKLDSDLRILGLHLEHNRKLEELSKALSRTVEAMRDANSTSVLLRMNPPSAHGVN